MSTKEQTFEEIIIDNTHILTPALQAHYELLQIKKKMLIDLRTECVEVSDTQLAQLADEMNRTIVLINTINKL